MATIKRRKLTGGRAAGLIQSIVLTIVESGEIFSSDTIKAACSHAVSDKAFAKTIGGLITKLHRAGAIRPVAAVCSTRNQSKLIRTWISAKAGGSNA